MSDHHACPDGGTCHHHCVEGCFRVECCSPLSGVYPDDEWPADTRLRAAYVAPVEPRAPGAYHCDPRAAAPFSAPLTMPAGHTITIANPIATQTSIANELYVERAQCVLALARAAQAMGCVAGFRDDPDLDEAEAARWPVLFIDLPTGQVSWHLTIEDRLSASDIGDYIGAWDRHDTAEKYRRLAAWRPT